MSAILLQVEAAINDLQQGKMIILTDDVDRENEGDLILPAETMTAEMMNFMIRHGTGIVCLALTSAQLRKLALPLMVPVEDNTSLRGTPFTLSIDAKEGITTGVSAADRAKTVLDVVNDQMTAADFVRPGHIFPLQAREHGVLERRGHTEGAIDLVKLSGFKPAAVLCELMNPDGTMMRGARLMAFAKAQQLNILSIEDLVHYRLMKENLIEDETSASLPLAHYGSFKITVIKEKITGLQHIVLHKVHHTNTKPPLVRIHSSCTTGDLFSSQRCDCHNELHFALKKISEEGGMLIYLNQEGRGIGLFNKIKAYALQEQGLDTVEANETLGLPIDSRNYYLAAAILRHYHISQIRLLTNNPHKIANLKRYGLTHITRIPIPAFVNTHNRDYLVTKIQKMHHMISLESNS